MKTYAFIFARGGSKGVPDKNIKEMCGKPLIAHSVEIAQNIDAIEKVFVSTEDEKISTIAKAYGADIISRPEDLAQDDSPEWLAWQHAINWLEKRDDNFDVFISLPATSPLRNNNDISKCLASLDKKTDIVVGITESNRSPYYNMVKKDDNGFIEIIINNNKFYTRRQETPLIFDMTTVAYVCRPEFIQNSKGIFHGKVKGVDIPIERSLDIDTKLDFEIAEFLMKKNILNTRENNAK